MAVASGANTRTKEPSKFMARTETKELIGVLSNTHDLGIAPVYRHKGGDTRLNLSGTFVCKTLVYEYASWVSPEFKVKVYNAYDALVTGKLQTPPDPQAHLNDPAWLRQTLIPRITPTPAPPVCDCGSSASHSQPAW